MCSVFSTYNKEKENINKKNSKGATNYFPFYEKKIF